MRCQLETMLIKVKKSGSLDFHDNIILREFLTPVIRKGWVRVLGRSELHPMDMIVQIIKIRRWIQIVKSHKELYGFSQSWPPSKHSYQWNTLRIITVFAMSVSPRKFWSRDEFEIVKNVRNYIVCLQSWRPQNIHIVEKHVELYCFLQCWLPQSNQIHQKT